MIESHRIYCTMYSAIRGVKDLVPVSVKARAQHFLSPSSDEELDRYRGRPKVVVALAADYGNLGDVAITYTQKIFLISCLPNHDIVDFPISSTFTRLKALKQVVTPDDVVTIVGGGNMGDLHYTIEDCRRFVIQSFPKNRIVSFPQTVDFSKTPSGRRELRKTIKVYRRHANLHLFARESISFDIMKTLFPDNHVYLVPDIVLSLNMSEPAWEREGIMLCMRKDNESSVSTDERSAFLQTLSSALPDAFQEDTHIGKVGLTVGQRGVELFKLLDCFKRAQVIVTDRLHGMIFSATTGTPCVVLPNKNHKIVSTYETWLQPLNFIRLQRDFNPLETIRAVEELRKLNKIQRQPWTLATQFETLKRVVIDR